MFITIARNTDGVLNVHELRSRRMGQDILLDIHLVVRPEISVSEGHQIGMQVVAGMRGALDNILDINFHIDAENDEDEFPTTEKLPSRAEVKNVIAEHLGEIPRAQSLKVALPQKQAAPGDISDEPDPETVFTPENIRHHLEGYSWFGSARVWVHPP